MRCPKNKWHSCILATSRDGIIKSKLLNDLALPPPLPKKDIDLIFFFFDSSKTLRIFFDSPEVERHINRSPSDPRASKDLANIFSNPISFPHAVKTEEFCDKEIIGIACLLFEGFNLTINSAARWLASAAEPPLPQKIILFLFKEIFNNLAVL